MHQNYDPQKESWGQLLDCDAQIGGGSSMIGFGQSDWAYFQGNPYQRGAGVGDVFRSLWRYLVPLGKSLGSAVGKEGLQTAHRVLADVVDGKDVKTSLRKGARTGMRNLLHSAADGLQQEGEGRRSRAPRKALMARGGPAILSESGRRKKSDVFGVY